MCLDKNTENNQDCYESVNLNKTISEKYSSPYLTVEFRY